MDQSPTQSPTETISAQLRMILCGVLAVLGLWRLEIAQKLLVHRRVSATFRGIERLLVRYRAGRLWQISHPATGQRRRGRKAAHVALPRRFGWLVQAGGHQAACLGSQLQMILNAPEMVALLAVCPQAGRMLRPLCRALAVELPRVRATPREMVADSGERPPRKCRPRVKPEPFRIPMPRGVSTAARRQGFGKIC